MQFIVLSKTMLYVFKIIGTLLWIKNERVLYFALSPT